MTTQQARLEEVKKSITRRAIAGDLTSAELDEAVAAITAIEKSLGGKVAGAAGKVKNNAQGLGALGALGGALTGVGVAAYKKHTDGKRYIRTSEGADRYGGSIGDVIDAQGNIMPAARGTGVKNAQSVSRIGQNAASMADALPEGKYKAGAKGAARAVQVGGAASALGQRAVGPTLQRRNLRRAGDERQVDPSMRRMAGHDTRNATSPQEARDALFVPRMVDDEFGISTPQPSNFMRYWQSRLPDPTLQNLHVKSGATPPSEGALMDASGKIIAQDVGHNEDHYLPFKGNKLKNAKGGEYVRTRTAGGLTTEDILAAKAGVKATTVVSHSGIFTIEFQDGKKDIGRMQERYGKLLDSLASKTISPEKISPDRRREITEQVRQDIPGISSLAVDRRANRVKEMEDDERKNPRPSTDTRDEWRRQFLLENAEKFTDSNNDPFTAERLIESSKKYGVDIFSDTDAIDTLGLGDKYAKYEKHKEREYESSLRELRLNGEGYDKALKALKEQFPYQIKSVNWTPPDAQSARIKDLGYVKAKFNRPDAVEEGYHDREIEGVAPNEAGGGSGKYAASHQGYQNWGARRAAGSADTPDDNKPDFESGAAPPTTTTSTGGGATTVPPRGPGPLPQPGQTTPHQAQQRAAQAGSQAQQPAQAGTQAQQPAPAARAPRTMNLSQQAPPTARATPTAASATGTAPTTPGATAATPRATAATPNAMPAPIYPGGPAPANKNPSTGNLAAGTDAQKDHALGQLPGATYKEKAQLAIANHTLGRLNDTLMQQFKQAVDGAPYNNHPTVRDLLIQGLDLDARAGGGANPNGGQSAPNTGRVEVVVNAGGTAYSGFTQMQQQPQSLNFTPERQSMSLIKLRKAIRDTGDLDYTSDAGRDQSYNPWDKSDSNPMRQQYGALFSDISDAEFMNKLKDDQFRKKALHDVETLYKRGTNNTNGIEAALTQSVGGAINNVTGAAIPENPRTAESLITFVGKPMKNQKQFDFSADGIDGSYYLPGLDKDEYETAWGADSNVQDFLAGNTGGKITILSKEPVFERKMKERSAAMDTAMTKANDWQEQIAIRGAPDNIPREVVKYNGKDYTPFTAEDLQTAIAGDALALAKMKQLHQSYHGARGGTLKHIEAEYENNANSILLGKNPSGKPFTPTPTGEEDLVGGSNEIEDAVSGRKTEEEYRNRPVTDDLRTGRTSDPAPAPVINQKKLDESRKRLNEMTGLEPVKAEFEQLINDAEISAARKSQGLPVPDKTMNLVFSGNPGTGKTTVAEELAQSYHALGLLPTDKVTKVTRSSLVGRYAGETAQKTKAVLDEAKGGVLFIDEAYALKTGDQDEYGQEAIDEIVAHSEDNRGDTVTILAGYSGDMDGLMSQNRGMKSRFPRTIKFPDYSPKELSAIGHGNNEKQRNEYTPEASKEFEAIATKIYSSENKGNARDIRNFQGMVSRAQGARIGREVGASKATKEQLQEVTSDDIKNAAELYFSQRS